MDTVAEEGGLCLRVVEAMKDLLGEAAEVS